MRQNLVKERFKQFIIGTSLSTGFILANGPLVNYVHEARRVYANWSLIKPNYKATFGSDPFICDELKKLINEALSDCKQINENEKRIIEFNPIYSTKPSVQGSLKTFGAAIGIPDYFNIISMSGLSARKLNSMLKKDYNFEVEDDSLWSTKDGLQLIDSFRLSRNAVKFLIARQIHATDSNFIIIQALMIFASCHIYFLMKRIFDRRVDKLPVGLRFMGRSLYLLVAMSILISVKSFIDPMFRRDADVKAITHGSSSLIDLTKSLKNDQQCSIDPYYFQGAIEYYTKLQQRQLAILNLTKTSWNPFRRHFFDSKGNELGLFSNEPYLTDRLDELKSWGKLINLN